MSRGLFLALCVLASPALLAFEVPPLTGRVVDTANVLSSAGRRAVEEASQKIEAQTGAQVAFLSVRSLDGMDIAQASMKVVEAWKLGSAKADDGVLLMVAVSERRMRIEVGQGLEGNLTDLRSRRILDDIIRPYLRRGSFDQGITQGMYAIAAAIDPQVDWKKICACDLAKPKRSQGPGPEWSIWIILGIMFILRLFSAFIFRYAAAGAVPGRDVSTSAILLSVLLSGGRRGGGFGGGGFGGGGFSGGGGGFSGGGGSSSW